LAQRTPPIAIEIIVVDNNSTDATAAMVREVASSTPMVRYVFEAAQGISYARNTGWALARGTIIAFTDDDVRVAPDWAARIHAAFAAHGEVDCVGGKVLPFWPTPPPSWLTREHWTPLAVLDYGDVPLRLDRNDARCLVGANMAFRRDVFHRVGGFSPAVQRVKDGIGSIEDHEFLIRLWDSGGRALYLPDLVVESPVDPRRLKKAYHRRWHYGHGHFHAVMRLKELERSAAGRLLDVPAHLYRQYLVDAAAWLNRVMRGQLDEAFLYEARMRFFWGFFRTRRREHIGRVRNRIASSRRVIVNALHKADDYFAGSPRLPRRVMFEAANPMLFNVFRPVYERLSADPRVSITLVPHGNEFTAGEIFAGASGRDSVATPRRAAWMKPDVYINTDLWSITWLRRRTRRVHLFHGVAGKYGLDAPEELAAQIRTFDRILFPNRDRLERYAAAGLVDAGGDQAVLAGYPKVDCLVDGSLSREAIAARLGLDDSRATIIYAPTWSEHSSLNTVGEQVISTLASAGLNVIVKLHACSYTARGSGGVDWRERLRSHTARHNVFVVDDADASPYLFVSDLLVTDHSTVGFEFMVLDRPVVVLHQPSLIDHARINPEKVALLQSAARVVHDIGEVHEAVRDELRRPERLSPIRRQLARDLFHGAGTATDRVMEVLYELLELPAEQPAHSISGQAEFAARAN
jgi:glycosyltransferase involved in cell wall biosynthesis